MRSLICSDIHGNREALEAVLAAVGAVDRIIVLGDIVGYGPEPSACIEILQEIGAICVTGNHEEIMVSLDRGLKVDVDEGALWTFENLSPDDRNWLETLPFKLPGEEIGDDLEGILFLHGCPSHLHQHESTNLDSLRELLMQGELRAAFVGHSHRPILWSQGEASRPHAGMGLLMRQPILVNGGSVGQPRDGNPKASFTLLNGDRISFHRVTYDIEETRRKLAQKGLPPWFSERLVIGR